jgi:hypothetical protein
LLLLSWNNVTAMGKNTGELVQADEKASGIKLDETLRDINGFAAMIGKIDALEAPSFEEEKDTALPEVDEHVLRAMKALELALRPVLVEVQNLTEDARRPEWGQTLKILCAIPADWPEEAGTFMTQKISLWLSSMTMKAKSVTLKSTTALDLTPEALWKEEIENARPIEGLTLLLACDSLISETRIHALSASGKLYGANHTEGIIAGEGAAAVLVAHPAQKDVQAVLADKAWERFARLEFMFPKDNAALEDFFKQGATPIGGMISNAGFEKKTRQQFFASVIEVSPDMDIDQDVLTLGSNCGELGCATPLHLIAAAAERACSAAGVPVGIYALKEKQLDYGGMVTVDA